jgi:hypothetical protein
MAGVANDGHVESPPGDPKGPSTPGSAPPAAPSVGLSETELSAPLSSPQADQVLAFLKHAWPVLLAAIPALATFLGLAFRLFPSIAPIPPPEERRVMVTELGLGERDRDLGDGVIVDVVYFTVELVGYTADDVAVDWLLFDAASRTRIGEAEAATPWDVIDAETAADRVVGELAFPPPDGHPGCIFVRIVLAWAAAPIPAAGQPRLLLDVADSDPFDPTDPLNMDCPDSKHVRLSTA